MIFIYYLFDPRPSKGYCYVGMGSMQRALSLYSSCRSGKCRDWILGLKALKLKPVVAIYYKPFLNRNAAAQFEIQEIARLRTELGAELLLNTAPGGTSGPGLSGTSHPMYGRRGNLHPTYGRKGKAKTGRENPMWGRRGALAPSSRAVLCRTNGKTYASLKEAGKCLGLPAASIANVASGKCAHVRGFVFDYEGQDRSAMREKRQKRETCRIFICNETGQTFQSKTKAGRQLGIGPSVITAILKGRRRSEKGLTFRYL